MFCALLCYKVVTFVILCDLYKLWWFGRCDTFLCYRVCSYLIVLVRSYPPRFGEAVADMAHGLLGRTAGEAVSDDLSEAELIANLRVFLAAGVDDYWEDVWILYCLQM